MKGSHIRLTAPVYKPNGGLLDAAAPGPRKAPLEQDATPLMPWNDNANPGPWGSPPEDERRDTPSKRPSGGNDGGGPRGPRGGGGPDLNAGFERLSRRMRGMFSP